MSLTRVLLVTVLCLCVTQAYSQSSSNAPKIGYVYPGGGQQGQTFRVTVGGQYLRGAKDVYVSGDGVKASVIKYMRPLRNLNGDQRNLIQSRIAEVYEKRMIELHGQGYARALARKKDEAEKSKKSNVTPKKVEENPEVKMPDHPLLYDLDNKTLRELEHIKSIVFMSRSKLQPNRQIAEWVMLEITVDPDAKPGNRELRLDTSTGLTNPIVFQVGIVPEINELEPNNRQAYEELPKGKGLKIPIPKTVDTPVIFNGQIMPGDIDRFRFRAKKDQQLVIQTNARSLIPYLADAVPGWFQATLTLFDDNGKELAFADDYRFNPDPVMFFEVPEDGEYEIEVRDSIYRGREDFVYRIEVGQQPFITQVFPLGAKHGSKTFAQIDGWNLDKKEIQLDTNTGEDGICYATCQNTVGPSNEIVYAIDSLPQCEEKESNDTIVGSQRLSLPMIVNGRIEKPGDVDIFRFDSGSSGKIVAEVFARRLKSPVDSMVKLTDMTGKVIQWNDDFVIMDAFLHKDITGTNTHHADSYLTADLPKPGTYYIHMTDTQNHGGDAYAYRLRISEPHPDFFLMVTPSSLNCQSGKVLPVGVYVLRKDGFDGEIELELKDAPDGFKFSPATIPPGKDYIVTTLLTPGQQPTGIIPLKVRGKARLQDRTITHTAIPADDTMQAFLYRHLLPAQELVIALKKEKWAPPVIELASEGPLKIRQGEPSKVVYKSSSKSIVDEIKLVLKEAPEGVTLYDQSVVPQGVAFKLKAESGSLEKGYRDNIIVEAFREYRSKDKKGRPTGPVKKYSMGILPAIPIEIIQ